jgi:PAS domain S-box-containing protein
MGCVVIGGVKLFLGLARDISDVERAELRYKTIVEAAPDPIFIQTDEKFAYLNPAACRFFGISAPEELVGTPVVDMFQPEYKEIILSRIHRLNIERQPMTSVQEYAYVGKEGVVWGETAGVPFEYDGKNGALVFLRDVTKRKETEQALQNSEKKYERLFPTRPFRF